MKRPLDESARGVVEAYRTWIASCEYGDAPKDSGTFAEFMEDNEARWKDLLTAIRALEHDYDMDRRAARGETVDLGWEL